MIRAIQAGVLLFLAIVFVSGHLLAQGELTLFFTGYVHGAHEPCG